jgi:PleD family two-component response regulator/glyoxylase-like metal-dependent hydrolase (beta-lactamase superfamily II)
MEYFQVTQDIYHIGDSSLRMGLDCNPYLFLDGEEAVVIDPGSPLDFEVVLANLQALVPLEKIKYIIVHHQDPDFVAALPLLESYVPHAKVVTSWRTMTLIQYYGINLEYYIIDDHDWQLELASGRILKFIRTPYLHFPGAFTTYDSSNQILFSSDLFGAISYNRTPYADDAYLEKMLTFHENYMPGNKLLRPVMDIFLSMPIRMILPQHGSIIDREPQKYIEALRELECGAMSTVVKQDLKKSGGYRVIFNDVLKRYLAIFDAEKVWETFEQIDLFSFDEDKQIVDYLDEGQIVWDKLFAAIANRNGYRWITVIEPFVRRLSEIYDIEIPHVVSTLLETMDEANTALLKEKEELDKKIRIIEERLTRCPVTGLHNELFLTNLLISELENEDWRDIGTVMLISIDDFAEIKYRYGEEESRVTLQNMAYLLLQMFDKNTVFKMTSVDFAVYLKEVTAEEAVQKAEKFRKLAEESQGFIIQQTVSIALSFPQDLEIDVAIFETTVERYLAAGLRRLRKARLLGSNCVCSSAEESDDFRDEENYVVLIADADETNLAVLQAFMLEQGVKVLTATDGQQALQQATQNLPNLIIAEVMLPKIDGFYLRERLMDDSTTKGIEMIFLSYQKDEKYVRRSLDLGISYYFKKPYLLSEIIGIVKQKSRGQQR